MSAPELPPLPHGFPIQMTPDPEGTPFIAYDADQMQAYATAAVLDDRERCAIRYRFLCSQFSPMGLNIDGNHAWQWRGSPDKLRGATMDAAIAAAIRGAP